MKCFTRLLFPLLFAAGCSTPIGRGLVDAGAGAGGAAIGAAFGDGNPGLAALGAGAGVGLAQGIRYATGRAKERRAQEEAELAQGRETKAEYWQRQNDHRPKENGGSQFYPVPLPERVTPDGVRLEPGIKWIEIRQ